MFLTWRNVRIHRLLSQMSAYSNNSVFEKISSSLSGELEILEYASYGMLCDSLLHIAFFK
jgi:hypothetical protein